MPVKSPESNGKSISKKGAIAADMAAADPSAKGKEKARYVDETSQLLSLASAASGNEEAIGKEKLSKGQARAAKAAAKSTDNEANKKPRKRKSDLDKAKADIIAKQLKKKAKKRKASKSVGGSGLSSVPSQTRKAVSFA